MPPARKPTKKPAPTPADVLAAAKLSRIPGVTIAEAAERYGLPASAVQRARRADPHQRLSSEELALAALTSNGRRRTGTLGPGALAHIATWLDYVNKDASTAADVRGILEGWVQRGVLALDASAWRLLERWP